MNDILNIIMSFGLSNEDMFWLVILLICIMLGLITACMYRTEPEYKITKTKDKEGNEVTVVSRIKK